MPRILGIETSRELCSAAVVGDGAVSERTLRMQRKHNEHILALVDEAMSAVGLMPADLDGVAFGCGPGSFTGIRIAASVAQAIALGAGASILPISSTLALASAALEREPTIAGGILTCIRSRRDAWYLAAYGIDNGKLHQRRSDCLVQNNPGWLEVGDGWMFVGDRPAWLDADIECRDDIAAGAGLIARLGAVAAIRGGGLAPELGLPVYLSGDSPWRKAGMDPSR